MVMTYPHLKLSSKRCGTR